MPRVGRVLAALAVVPALLRGQGLGGVEGRVYDPSGRPIAAADVSVSRGTGSPSRASTDAGGGWRITHLAPGDWLVSVRRVGYRPASVPARIAGGASTRLTITLEPVPFLLDSLIASAPALRISTTSTELGTRLTVDEISVLPTTVDVRQLVQLTPGARPNQIWGGAGDQANAYLLDGTLVNHVGVGGVFFLPSPSWIESFEVRGLGAGAELGNFQGGLVDVVTLNGGNVLEGRFRSSFESHRFNGSNLVPEEVGRELSHRRELDGQLRGPLLRDKLHFALFGHLIDEEERIPNQLPGTDAEFTAAAPATRDVRWLGKLSWKPGRQDDLQWSLMGRHLHGDRVGQTGFETPEATERLRDWSLTGSLAWKRVWSARSTFEVRAGGYLARQRQEPYGGELAPGVETFTTASLVPRYGNAPFLTRAEPVSLSLSARWHRRGRVAGLEHELIAGGELVRGGWMFDRRRSAGMTWQPWPSAGFHSENPATWPGSPFAWMPEKTIGTLWGGEVRLDSEVSSDALFLQDHIRVTRWLRINPGLRYGWWSGSLTPLSGPQFTAVRDQALEPRLGLIADLDGKGGFVAKAHFGRYHQSMFASLFDRVEGADVFSDQERWSYLGTPPATRQTAFTRAQRDDLAASGVFRLEERIGLNQVGRVENYRQPYVDQGILALERSFGGRWKAGLIYVHRRNRNQVALVDRNIASNYTIIENVVVRDRLPVPLYLNDEPLVLEKLALSNRDVIRVWNQIKAGALPLEHPTQLMFPPGMSFAQLDALRYEPDFVLTTVPKARRHFDQLQVAVDARYRSWWAGGSFVLTFLTGNFNAISGADDYSTGGPGPFVRLNEQFNFEGSLANQSRFEGKLHAGALLPFRLKGGMFFSIAGGDRVTPTLTISTLVTQFALVVPDPEQPTVLEAKPFAPQLLASINGERMFLLPRGSYRFETRASLDLHLERTVAVGRRELELTLDGFNVLGDRSISAIETNVNSTVGIFSHDYGRARARVAPRTLRIGGGIRF